MEQNIFINWQEIVKIAVTRRKEQGYTQEELAVIAGVSKPTLNDFEQGRKTIKVESLFKILKVLGLGE